MSSVPTYDLYGERQAERTSFWVHCETIAARSSAYQWEIGLHRHESFFQILYIHNGAGDALLEDQTVALKVPCVVLMPPGAVHGYRFSRDVEGFVVTIVADQLRLTSGVKNQPAHWLASPQAVAVAGGDGAFIDAIIRRVSEECEGSRRGRNELLEAYLTTVLMLIGRSGAEAAPSDAPGDPRQARVEMLNDLINLHFRAQLPAAEYARLLNLSPTHLNRIVRATTGMTVHDLIMSRVIEEARRALVFTPGTVQGIADGLGFSDAAYFSRCFRRRTGQTPGQFRRNERQKLKET